jgi:hypothetical protein
LGNLQNDPVKMYERYNYAIHQMNHIMSGNAGNALNSNKEYWSDLFRREAVKMGNRIHKFTGAYPNGFHEIANKPIRGI